MKLVKIACGLAATAMFMWACEKPILDEEAEEPAKEQTGKDKGNVVLRVADFTMVPYDARATRAVQNISDYCTRLCFVVYKDDKKVKGITQAKTDDNYGEVSMVLDPGEYKLLVLAHNSQNENPVLSNPESIQFTNAIGYTDTFYYYGDLTVTSQPQTHDLALTRASSKLNFIIIDEIPSNVAYLKFYYTGGSGVLNATTGFGGMVNSQQEALWNISGVQVPVTLPIYTFLQDETGKLQLTVTALAADKETVVVERKFADVPMKRNMVTVYEGSFFDHTSNNTFTMTAETGWDEYQKETYAF